MNTFLKSQCRNMIVMVGTFEQACKLAAAQDDGNISKEEEKALKAIRAAADKFKNELRKIADNKNSGAVHPGHALGSRIRSFFYIRVAVVSLRGTGDGGRGSSVRRKLTTFCPLSVTDCQG